MRSVLDGLECALPLLGLRLSDVEEADAAPTLDLQEHQALSCLAVLMEAEKGEAGEMLQAHVIMVEVEGHGQALEGGVELQGSEAVERGLTLGAVVLVHLQGLRGQHGRRHGCSGREGGCKAVGTFPPASELPGCSMRVARSRCLGSDQQLCKGLEVKSLTGLGRGERRFRFHNGGGWEGGVCQWVEHECSLPGSSKTWVMQGNCDELVDDIIF